MESASTTYSGKLFQILMARNENILPYIINQYAKILTFPVKSFITLEQNSYKVTWHKHKKHTHTHTHTRLTALFPGLLGWAGTRKVKPTWILLMQETVSGSGISWAICKSAPRSRQITMPAPHHSVFYRPDALADAQTTASKHWRPLHKHNKQNCKTTDKVDELHYKNKTRNLLEMTHEIEFRINICR